jgi:uncharacterized protein (DUF1778 family)
VTKKKPRQLVKKLRVTKQEEKLWQRAADIDTDGNVSMFVRHATTQRAQQVVAAADAPAEATAPAE